MTIATATLAGNQITDARLTIPAWGVSWHDVAIDREVTLSGRVTLAAADLPIQGTIVAGGPASGRSFYRLVAGAGGWGKTLPKKSYSNDLGVKLSTVLVDAASAVGETLDTTSFDTSTRLGPAFVRPEGPACRLLEQLAPKAWYVREDGVTRLGARPASALTAAATPTTQLDQARGTLTLASETIAGILPGLVFQGLTAVDVEHTFDAKSGLRSKLWFKQGDSSRRISAIQKIVDQLDPDRAFRGIVEYRIVTQAGERLNLQAVRVSTGMPDLGITTVRPGVPGAKATHTLGARVLVGFVDSDPSRPVVVGFEDAEGPGFKPGAATFAASASITVDAPVINVAPAGVAALGGGVEPVALAPPFAALLSALATYIAAIQPVADPTGTATSTMASAITTATPLIPATKATAA